MEAAGLERAGSLPVGSMKRSRNKCGYCAGEFTLLKRKRKCKMCEKACCSDCCSVKACYPLSYGYGTPQWACNECSIHLFNFRSSSPVDAASISRTKSPTIIEGSYHTCEDGDVHTAYKMADPVSRLFFRYSGMYEGGKFDRSSSKKLMTLKKAIVKLPSVGDVSRHLIPVPLCVNEQNWDIGTLYMTPPFIKRKKKKKSRKQRKEAKKEEAESGHDVGLGPTSAIVSPKSDVVGPVNSELGSINVFVYKPKEMDENETLPVVVCCTMYSIRLYLLYMKDLVPRGRLLRWQYRGFYV